MERREWGVFFSHKRLRRQGLTAAYENLPSAGFDPDWADLENIYRLVRRRKPKTIIEFGSGCSTLMFAQALLENSKEGQPGHLYSIDTSEFFLAETRQYIPEEMKPLVTLSYSDYEIYQDGAHTVLKHTSVPDVIPNLVYSDGPSFSAECNISADAVLLEESSDKDDFAILIDGRKPTFRYTGERLTGKYKVTANTVHHWELLERI